MKTTMNRRQFTKAGLTAAGVGVASSLASRVYAGGDETIKVAIVGCGSRGTGAVSQILRTKGPVKLWAMADLFGDRLESSLASLVKGSKGDYDRETHGSLADQIDVPPDRRFVGFDAYQKAIDSGVDLVVLTAHQHFRPLHFAYAVKQGKNVFMEKPLGVDSPGVRQILETNEEAKRKNLKVGVGLCMRHNERVKQAIARVKDGAIGPLSAICCYFNMAFLRDTTPKPSQMTEMEYQLRNPYHFVWLCGDYILDAVVHYFDLSMWVHGGHPVTAQGQGGRQYYLANQAGDAFDHQIVEFTFEDRVKLFAQCRLISGCWNQSGTHIYGLDGWANLLAGRIEGKTPWQLRKPIPNPYQVEQDLLVDAIRNNRPYNDVEHAATATLVGVMGRMASYSGQQVTWDQVLKSETRLAPERYAFDATPPAVPGPDGRYPVAMPGVTMIR
jgi:predicted dehydrogenase